MHHYTESFTCEKNISQARNGEVAVAVHSIGRNTESRCVLIMKHMEIQEGRLVLTAVL